jgi:dTDP-glucose 4,6-dehydratase
MRILVAGAAGFIGSHYAWDDVVPVTDRKGHDRRYCLDDSLLQSMGYAPRVPFSDGLKATIEWYAAHRGWWEPLRRPTPAERPQAAR